MTAQPSNRALQFSLKGMIILLTVISLDMGLIWGLWPWWKERQAVTDLRDRILLARKSADAGAAYRELLLKDRPDRTLRLLEDSNDSIALTAAFASHNSRVDTANELLPFDKEAFITFLKQRTRLNPPAWWIKEFPNGFVWSGPKTIRYPYWMEEDETIIVFWENRRLRLTSAQSKKIKNGGATTLANIGRERSYLARSGNGWAFQLYCIDTPTGDVVWQTDVWALGAENAKVYRVRGQAAELWLEGDRVVVWGAGTGGCYVEAFDANSGVNLFRFTTSNYLIR